jgi:hypothetical protein
MLPPGRDPHALRIETLDPDMVAVLAAKTGAERLAIAAAMFRAARRMLSSELAAMHPEWSAEQVAAEVARRLALGTG